MRKNRQKNRYNPFEWDILNKYFKVQPYMHFERLIKATDDQFKAVEFNRAVNTLRKITEDLKTYES